MYYPNICASLIGYVEPTYEYLGSWLTFYVFLLSQVETVSCINRLTLIYLTYDIISWGCDDKLVQEHTYNFAHLKSSPSTRFFEGTEMTLHLWCKNPKICFFFSSWWLGRGSKWGKSLQLEKMSAMFPPPPPLLKSHLISLGTMVIKAPVSAICKIWCSFRPWDTSRQKEYGDGRHSNAWVASQEKFLRFEYV